MTFLVTNAFPAIVAALKIRVKQSLQAFVKPEFAPLSSVVVLLFKAALGLVDLELDPLK